MKNFRFAAVLASAALAILFHALPASAQATRTWVSGVGDDANPCSRTAPCKTFAGAISKTAVGGIINCLDPGGFGAVSITKAMTIDCSGTFAGILAANTNGVNVVAGAADTVILRGLSIEGNSTGLIGVNVTGAGAVHIENCRIFQFNTGTATGIRFAPTAGGRLYVVNSSISNNGNVSGGGGIVVRPGGGTGKATLSRVELRDNSNGLVSDGSGGATYTRVQIVESVVAGSTNAGVVSKGSNSSVFLTRSSTVLNGGPGLQADGSTAQVIAADTTISDNGQGLSVINGGHAYSYATNNVNANLGPDGMPFPSYLPQN